MLSSSRWKKYRWAALAFSLFAMGLASPVASAQDGPGGTGVGESNLMQSESGPPRGPMSQRFQKYMPDDGGVPGGPGGDGMRGGGMRRRFQNLPPEQQQRLKERLQGMSRDERRQFIQQMRQRGGQQPGMNLGPESRPRRPGPGPGASGRGRRGSMQGGRQWFGRKPIRLDVLNLSDEQKSKIQQMRQENSVRARRVNKDLRAKRSRLKEMLFDPGATKKQILDQQASYNSLRSQADDIMVNDFLGIRSVLTKEQLKRLPEIKPGRRSQTRSTRSVGAKRLNKKSAASKGL